MGEVFDHMLKRWANRSLLYVLYCSRITFNGYGHTIEFNRDLSSKWYFKSPFM